MTQTVNNDNFQSEVLDSDMPVLVDFFATWCGPCQALAPVIDELANEVGDNFKIVKIDVDEAPEIAEKYEIMSIPSLKIFKGGEVVDEPEDRSKEGLLTALEKQK